VTNMSGRRRSNATPKALAKLGATDLEEDDFLTPSPRERRKTTRPKRLDSPDMEVELPDISGGKRTRGSPAISAAKKEKAEEVKKEKAEAAKKASGTEKKANGEEVEAKEGDQPLAAEVPMETEEMEEDGKHKAANRGIKRKVEEVEDVDIEKALEQLGEGQSQNDKPDIAAAEVETAEALAGLAQLAEESTTPAVEVPLQNESSKDAPTALSESAAADNNAAVTTTATTSVEVESSANGIIFEISEKEPTLLSAAGLGAIIEVGKGTEGRCGDCPGCRTRPCGDCSACKRGDVGSCIDTYCEGEEAGRMARAAARRLYIESKGGVFDQETNTVTLLPQPEEPQDEKENEKPSPKKKQKKKQKDDDENVVIVRTEVPPAGK